MIVTDKPYIKVLAIVGASGTGKSTIVENLTRLIPTVFHEVLSYTDRPKRFPNEGTHLFVDSDKMDKILENKTIVAYTEYGCYRYCASLDQFRDDKINLYIVDNQGIKDLRKCNDVRTIVIRVYRTLSNKEIDNRRSRDTQITQRCDFEVNNEGNILDTLKEVYNIYELCEFRALWSVA